jgi:hypothetical protein
VDREDNQGSHYFLLKKDIQYVGLVFTMKNGPSIAHTGGKFLLAGETSLKFTKRVRRCPFKSGERCDRRFC